MPSIVASDQSEAILMERYRIARSYIEHEDKLASERISRTLLVHGFLLASYVLLIQARVTVAVNYFSSKTDMTPTPKWNIEAIFFFIDTILPLIALIGIFTTFAARQGLWASEKSVASIRDNWEAFTDRYAGAKHLGLPSLTGGGSEQVEQRGEGSQSRMLRYLLILWAIVLTLSVSIAAAHLFQMLPG